MNYLAHLYFAQPTVESRVGNLLGDFARGIDQTALPEKVLSGLKNHRAIDHFTDQHPEVRALKSLFSKERRRFSGIILDVLFDHFLIQHWATHHPEPLLRFLDTCYRDLKQGEHLMPEHMQHVIGRMIENDWISSYAELDSVGFALDRIASRIRFRNNFTNALPEIETHYVALEQGFLRFFPDLEQFVADQALERG